MGIPEYEAKRYEGRVREGGILLSVHCDDSEWVKRAKSVLPRRIPGRMTLPQAAKPMARTTLKAINRFRVGEGGKSSWDLMVDPRGRPYPVRVGPFLLVARGGDER